MIPAISDPPWLQLIQNLWNPLSSLEEAGRAYGDIFKMHLIGTEPVVVVSSPQAIEQILSSPADSFRSGDANVLFRPLLGQSSLVLLDGEQHRQQRRILMPLFIGEQMRSYGSIMRDVTKVAIAQYTIGRSVSVRGLTTTITLDIILKAVFGSNYSPELKTQVRNIQALFDSPASTAFIMLPGLQHDLGSLTPWGTFLQYRRHLDELIYAEIAVRRRSTERGTDLLSKICQLEEDGQKIPPTVLRDQVMTLLFAGHETTASALAWALYWVCQTPRVKVALLREISGLEDPEEIAQLPYLAAVISESLRIYPPTYFAFARTPQSDFQLGAYIVPRNTPILPSVYLVHHRPEIFSEPKCFRPERFLERSYSAYEYLPFGGGVRRCLGIAFALYEMKVVLATLLQSRSFELQAATVKPIRRNLTLSPEEFSVVIHPA